MKKHQDKKEDKSEKSEEKSDEKKDEKEEGYGNKMSILQDEKEEVDEHMDALTARTR